MSYNVWSGYNVFSDVEPPTGETGGSGYNIWASYNTWSAPVDVAEVSMKVGELQVQEVRYFNGLTLVPVGLAINGVIIV